MRKKRRTTILIALFALAFGTAHAQPAGRASGQVADLPAQVERIDTAIEEAEATIVGKRREAARARTEVEQLRARAERARSQLRSRVRALYRIRRAGVLPVAGGVDALLSHLSRIERLERIVESDLESIRFLEQREAGLRSTAQLAEEAVEATERSKRALVSRRERLRAQMSAYGYLSDGFLPNLPVAPLPEQRAGGYASIRVVDDAAPRREEGFAALRGRLGMPVPGASTIRDAVRDDGPGLEFVTSAGTAVRCVGDGRVAFARAYGSYGRVVIVDHGRELYTVYGGLGRIEARVGDPIARGDRLGTVGSASEPALFFEVRQGTRSLDARAWIGL